MANEITLPTPPEGYEYVIQKKPKSKEEQLTELISQKDKIKKPSDEELKELGMYYHPYFILEDKINTLIKS